LLFISLFIGTLDLMNMFIITYPYNGNVFIIIYCCLLYMWAIVTKNFPLGIIKVLLN